MNEGKVHLPLNFLASSSVTSIPYYTTLVIISLVDRQVKAEVVPLFAMLHVTRRAFEKSESSSLAKYDRVRLSPALSSLNQIERRSPALLLPPHGTLFRKNYVLKSMGRENLFFDPV